MKWNIWLKSLKKRLWDLRAKKRKTKKDCQIYLCRIKDKTNSPLGEEKKYFWQYNTGILHLLLHMSSSSAGYYLGD